jgi:hypothetical protein
MKKITILYLFLLSSCSIWSPKQQSLSDQYVTGLGLSETDSGDIIFNLKRDKPLAGGNYQLEIYPRTKYLNSVEKVLDQNDKTCFDFKIVVREFKVACDLSKWKIKFSPTSNLDFETDYEEVAWDKIGEITERKIPGPWGLRNEWTQEARGCISRDYAIENGFKLAIFPNFIAWPFPEREVIDWQFDRYVLIDGKVELREKGKPSNFKAYRRW